MTTPSTRQPTELRIEAAAQAIVVEACDRRAWDSFDESARTAFRRYARAALAVAQAPAVADLADRLEESSHDHAALGVRHQVAKQSGQQAWHEGYAAALWEASQSIRAALSDHRVTS